MPAAGRRRRRAPPRWPTRCHSSTWSDDVDCPAGAASAARRTRSTAPRGARMTASALMIAPCGGARPSGRSSCDPLVERRPSKRFARGRLPLRRRARRGLAGRDGLEAARAADLGPAGRCGRARRAATLPQPHPSTSASRPAATQRRLPPDESATTAAAEPPSECRCDSEPNRVRRSARPSDGAADDDVRGQDPAHGTASPFRSAIRAGPMPGIASSASTEVNGPCSWR